MYFHDLHRKSTERYSHPVRIVECWAFYIVVPTRNHEFDVDFWYVNKDDRYGQPVSKEAAIDKVSAIYDSISEYHITPEGKRPARMEFNGTKVVDIEETTERNGY